MMRQMRNVGLRTLAGGALVFSVLLGVGAGVFHVGDALAGYGARRPDILAAGVDMMPVGTAKQVTRAKQLRPQRP